MKVGTEQGRGIRQVARQSVLYGLGTLGPSLVTLLLIPVFTRRLSRAEYGILNLTETTASLAALVLYLGLEASLIRHYFVYPTEEERREAVSSLALVSLWPMLVFAVPVFLSRDWLSRLLFRGDGFSDYILLAFGIAAALILCQMGLGYVRSRDQAIRYGWLNGVRILLYALLGCFAVLALAWGAKGALAASLVAQGLIGVVSFAGMLRQVGLKLAWDKILRGLRYGLPLVPSGLALWVMALSDRYFLSRYNGLDAVGVYSMGYQLGTAPMFFFSAFQLAWPQFAFRIAGDAEAGRTYARLTRYAALGGGMAFLVIGLFAGEWVRLLSGNAYRGAASVIPLVALAHMAYAGHVLFATGITIREKMGWLPLITGTSAAVNLVANFLLIPRLGLIGAALATLAGYLVLATLTYVFSNRYLPVPYEFGKIGRVLGMILLIWLLSILVNHWAHPALGLGGRIVLCLAFPPLAVLIGGASREEVKKLWSLRFLK